MFKRALVITVLLSTVFVAPVHAQTIIKTEIPGMSYLIVPVQVNRGFYDLYIFNPKTGQLWQKEGRNTKLQPVFYEFEKGKLSELPFAVDKPDGSGAEGK